MSGRRSLTGLLRAVLVLVVLGTALIVVTPGLLTRWFAPGQGRARKDAPSPEKVDAFLDGALPRIGATDVLGQAQEDGVPSTTFRMPAGADPLDAARRLRAFADERAVEVYVTPEDGLDARVRVYAGPTLYRQLLLVPTLPAEPPVARPRTPRERPLLALVVAGLGDAPARDVLEAPFPLTLAVDPFTPFSLRIGHDAALGWQEILVHVSRSTLATGRSIQDAVAAVPHATGLLLDEAPSPELADVRADLAVFPARFTTTRAPPELGLLAAQLPGRAGTWETLARTCHLAVRDGVAAMVVDAADPELARVLAWAHGAESQGYRLVMASEAVRADELRGAPWEGVRTR